MQICTARWEAKQGSNMAEEMLISAEESVMANFDFLSREGGEAKQGFPSDTIYYRFESGSGSLFGLRQVEKLKDANFSLGFFLIFFIMDYLRLGN
jgi:hypothetical protein